ncbi:1018_t:CDS:2, partial [Scutellospora calospora]
KTRKEKQECIECKEKEHRKRRKTYQKEYIELEEKEHKECEEKERKKRGERDIKNVKKETCKECEEREQKEEEKERLEGGNRNVKNWAVTLVSSRTIKPHLHYRLFSRNWWFIPKTKSNNDIKIIYPIRVGMKTQVEINRKKFIIHILEGNKFYKNQSGYSCYCDSGSSEIEDNLTNVIISLYRQIFKTQTKILGSIIIGFDKESILAKLLHDIKFRLYSISIADKLSVMVFSLDISKKEENKSVVEIWNNNIKILYYEGSSPVD